MPKQSHRKGSEREQGRRAKGVGREGKGREGKQSGAGGAGEEQRRWARKKKQTKHQCTAHVPLKTAKRERYMTPRIGASRAEWSSDRAPRLDCPGVNPVPRTGASEATERIRQKDAPDWSIWGGMKHGPSPRTGSSGGEPGATDWSV